MIEKLVERKNRESEAARGVPSARAIPSGDRVVSDKALFAQLGSKLKVAKKGEAI